MATNIAWTLRLARMEDIRALEMLIPVSVRALQKDSYSPAQMEAALGSVFGVDQQLILDESYFVAEACGEIVGCGGWSRRKSKFGSSAGRTEPDPEMDPKMDAPRIRAFFVHPQWARQGIGRAILVACEAAILRAGFRRAEIAATLTGEALYASMGYEISGRFDIPLSNGLKLQCVQMAKTFAENRIE
jgi:GNAT superfamily N-acetyltransferase